MKAATYYAIADLIGVYLAETLPRLYVGDNVPPITSAIYVGVGPLGDVRYVGSVHRPRDPSALIRRMREHRSSERWAVTAVFPLRPETPRSTVRELEGTVGDVLWPLDTRRLPRSILPRVRAGR